MQIDISHNELCGLNWRGEGTYTTVGIEAIADALRVTASLTDLNLFYNSIGSEGGVALAGALRANTSLTSLTLDREPLPVKQLKGTDPVTNLDLSNKGHGHLSSIVIGSLITVNASLTSME